MADFTQSGLTSLVNAVDLLRKSDTKRVDLGHNTIVYKVPSNHPKKYIIRIDMKFNEESEV